MKKILFITDIRHAAPRIPGVIKYIRQYGYEPILLSPTRETDFQYFGEYPLKIPKCLQKIALNGLLFYQSVFQFPDEMKSRFEEIQKQAQELINNNDMGAVISSSSPVSSHIVAYELKKKYNLPWIADLRDLWSQNHNYPYGPFRRWRDTRLEMRTLSYADVLITVSEPLAKTLKKRYPDKNVMTITNGFDPETRVPVPLTKKFTITYTGQIYEGRQDMELFKKAYVDLINAGTILSEDSEFRLFGPQGTLIPKKDAVLRQRESQVLLLLNWMNNEGVYTLKIFEYLAAGRPVLSVGGRGGDVIEELLGKTNAGVYARTGSEVKQHLARFYREYKETGKTTYYGIEEEINKYSFVEIARHFSGVLDKCSH